MYDNPWCLEDGTIVDEPPEGALAFVYVIENKKTGRKYIGKKLFVFKKTKRLKGKRVKRSTIESDWKTYYGSNGELIDEVAAGSKDDYGRTIIRFCSTKGEANYFELREQMINDVLLFPDMYYNSYVGSRIGRNHLKSLLK